MRKVGRLSICIPTYNRADFLAETVKSFLKQDPKLEINIADNASSDATPQVVVDIKYRFGQARINYCRHRANLGFDRNVLRVVEMATRDFCWLVSDDDLPLPGAVKKIQGVISLYPSMSLIHVNYSRMDNLLHKVTAKRMVGSIFKDQLFTDANDFFFKPVSNSYFKFLGTNTITLSTNVVNRRLWLKAVPRIKKYIGHNFIHSFAIATLIRSRPKIYYLAVPCVQYLANNHRIWPNDIWRDYNQTLLGYMQRVGYTANEVANMRDLQREYEQREFLTKTGWFRLVYERIGQPLISWLRYLKVKLVWADSK